jgi:hypothetical protein
VLFAGELFGWAQAVGMVLVLGGVVAGQRLRGRRTRAYWSRTPARVADFLAIGTNRKLPAPQDARAA